MFKDKLGLVLLILVIFNTILYPYALLNEESLIYTIVHALSFINLTGIAFYFGKKKDININLAFLIAILLALINLVIFKDDSLGLIRIIPCIIIWNKVSKYFDKFIYIPIFFMIALLSSFYIESWLIALFPFYLLGAYELKIPKKVMNVLSIIALFGSTLVTIFILKRFYVSFDILNLSVITSKKHLIFRTGYFGLSSLFLLALGTLFKTDENGNKQILTVSLIPLISHLFLMIVSKNFYNNLYILYALIASILLILLINNKYADLLINELTKINKMILTIISLILLVIYLVIPYLKVNYKVDLMYPKMSEEEISEINDSFKISFVGDLIMLENQVKSGFDGEKYNYDKMFEYTKKYLSSSDLTIGTLEGPVANKPYTVGNFDDGVALYLNYPVEFAESVKNSGIDLVTLANNHMFDQGVDGYKETIENLDKIKLDYVEGLNNNVKILEKENLKIGILTYTYGANYYTEEDLIRQNVKSLIVSPASKNFNKIKKNVKKDFENLKKENVDLIIVLPHMGTQFSHEIDVFQNTWNKIFAEYGADIILGNHAHAVEPIEYIDDTFIVNCPGNFANQYSLYDGDATSIVDIYVNKETKKVVSSAVIPMYTQANNDGFYRALPIYEIMTNKELYDSLSLYEMERIKEVHDIITEVMLGEKIDITNIEERYFYFKDGYKRNKVVTLDISSYSGKELYQELSNASNYCFIGDSVTEGTKNGGYGWYEPLINNFKGEVKTAAHGSYTTKMLLERKSDEIKNCVSDINIIAIGTNDIRYREEDICAMDEKEYIENIKRIEKLIKSEKKDAKIVFIAPWTSLVSDNVTPLSQSEKEILFEKYSKALSDYAKSNSYLYINPNEYILNKLKGVNSKYYLKDHIHPNKINGINLYSEAVISS